LPVERASRSSLVASQAWIMWAFCRSPGAAAISYLGRGEIQGRRQEKEEKNKNYHYSERAYGSFQRAFEPPMSVDRNKVSADFSKGVLTITLPKTADAQKQQKKIEIKSA
jgi:hypothetical protein